jgi:hypothetical protein
MIYMLDASKQPGSGAEFTQLQDIGYTDLGLAVAAGSKKVFYFQRANRGCGHQGDGNSNQYCGNPANSELKDFHLLSVSYDAATNYAITDYGLLQDQSGRLAWRAPGMATDGNSKVFLVGDWYTMTGDITSSNTYHPVLNRSEFIASADVSGADVLPITASLGTAEETVPAAPPPVRVYPNPWQNNGAVIFANLPKGSSVGIYSISGRLIKSLEIENGSAKWDMAGKQGKPVVSGVYFYRISMPGQKMLNGKLTVMR